MKKIILASLLSLFASSVLATDGCDDGASKNVPVTSTSFIRVAFNTVCSQNVTLVYTDDAANQKVYGGSASKKGAGYFGASTLGGAVLRVGACTNNSCAAEVATKALAGSTAAAAYGT
jgi:hypothetical protein